jgi:hypothetical protein
VKQSYGDDGGRIAIDPAAVFVKAAGAISILQPCVRRLSIVNQIVIR